VRSPTLVDGVSVAPAVKTAAEEAWLKKEKRNGKWRSLFDYAYDCYVELYQEMHNKSLHLGIPERKFPEGNFSYIGENVFEGHKIIEVRFEQDNFPIPGFCILSIIPEEHQIIKYESGTNRAKQELIMAKQDDTIWFPKKYSLISIDYAAKRRYFSSRDFHSFKKTHVETNIEFNDAESDSNPLNESVKSKTQFDMKTPVPPKEETPASKKEH
jgi:hypothetical protein